MTLIFPLTVVGVFLCASIICFCYGEVGKGWFYLLSALINFNVMFLKG